MDLKTLYHNPDEFSDEELAKIRSTIRAQQRMPWFCAAFSSLGFYATYNSLYRRVPRGSVVALAAVAGWSIGCLGASSFGTLLHGHGYDQDILRAFEQRQLQLALNISGRGSMHVSSH